MKVFMSHPDWNEPGGPTGHLPILISELENRPDVELHCFVYGFRPVRGLPRRLCQTLPLRLGIMVGDIAKFLWMCLRYGRPDVLHLNSSYEIRAVGRDIPYLVLCRLLTCACVIKTHGSDETMLGKLAWPKRSIQLLHFRLAQAITFLSPVEAQQFRDRFPAHAHKFHVAKNIVLPNEREARQAVPGRILFGGRFVEKKNIPNLLEGFARIAEEFPAAHLVIAGSGPLEQVLRAQVSRSGLEDRVTWTGWVDRETLRALADESAITVFTSTGSEGMPMVLVEALNSNSLVVTTSVRWTRSYPIKDLGVIELDGPSPDDICEGLRAALSMPRPGIKERRDRRAFLIRFSKETVTQEFIELYEATTTGIGR